MLDSILTASFLQQVTKFLLQQSKMVSEKTGKEREETV